jgi:serine protease Do
MKPCLLSLLLILLLPVTAAVAQPVTHQVRSGTGFFVSKYGHIVTNAHVVKGCDTVSIRGAVKPLEAKVTAVDEQVDLALIKAEIMPTRIANFRAYNQALKKGEGVLLIGYPGESAISGQYQVVQSTITDTRGPLNNPQWVQFSDAARQGNSGGPLLDVSGNVVGVVVGKTTVTRRNLSTGQEEIVQKADIAITLEYLKRFLEQHQVMYQTLYSGLQYASPYMTSLAKDYIVNIHCQEQT